MKINICQAARCSWPSEQLRETGEAFYLTSIKQLSKHSNILSLLSPVTTIKAAGQAWFLLLQNRKLPETTPTGVAKPGLEARAPGDPSTGLLHAHTVPIVPRSS